MRYCKVQPEASLVNWPQALTERRLLHLFLFTFLNKWQKMISCARVYWIFPFISRSFHPRLCFIAFKMKFNYPVPSHFQFSGRDGSGTWKKVRDGSGTGIPSDPAHQMRKTSIEALFVSPRAELKFMTLSSNVIFLLPSLKSIQCSDCESLWSIKASSGRLQRRLGWCTSRSSSLLLLLLALLPFASLKEVEALRCVLVN